MSPRRLLQLCGRSLCDQHAVGEHTDPVGELLGLVEIVRGEQHRGAQAAELGDQLPRLAAGGGVEAGGRLVEEQHVGVADDAEREVEPALLPTRQRVDAGVGLVVEPDQTDDLGR